MACHSARLDQTSYCAGAPPVYCRGRPHLVRCRGNSELQLLDLRFTEIDPGCVKTQKIVERRERFFQDEVKSDSLRNFCAPKREFAKGPFYRLRSPSCFYAAKTLSGPRRI